MRYLIILGVCVVVLVVLITLLFRPAPKPEIIGDLTPTQEKEIQAKLIKSEALVDSLQKELSKSKADGKVAEKAFKSVIKAQVKTIAELKSKPEVIEIVESTPAIDSLHQAYEHALDSYENRIISLTDELKQRDELNAQIQQNFEKRLADTQSLLLDKEAEVTQLQKENRRLRRKLTGTKIIGALIVIGIGAIAVR